MIFLAGLGGCCTAHLPAKKKTTKPCVLVTIAPYQFLVEQIGGDALHVLTIAPPGTNPHTYEPTIRQVAKLKEGLVWFRIGESFEDKIIPNLKKERPDLLVVDLREGIDLISIEGEGCCHCCHHSEDRHIWLSPARVSQQAKAIEHALSQKFPHQKELFAARLAKLQEALSSLEEELDTLLAPFSNSSLVVSHPAFGYFCKDFHLHQLSIEQEGKEPRPRHLEQIVKEAKETHATLALALPQYNNKGVELIAKDLKLPLYTIDPYAPDCLATMKTLAHLMTHLSEEKL